MKMKKIHCLFTMMVISMALYAQTKKSLGQQYTRVSIVSTIQGAKDRLTAGANSTFSAYPQPVETDLCVFVDPAITFQRYLGIGAALTDASAETFYKLPKAAQQEFMKAYFDKTSGIGYTLGRTNIASCDFSSGSYTYVTENDRELNSFSVVHDEKYKIPFIKEAIKAAGGKLRLYASPWTPPAWMKDNNDLLNGGSLKQEYAQAWANHYVKFIKTYEAKGIPIWGLSVQNEPMAKQRWESCIYTAEGERDFIKNFLGPTLQKTNLASKKLIAWDHNRDLMYQRASVILGDKDAAKYVWGIGFHWYETWTGSPMLFKNLAMVSAAFKETNLIFTEGCKEKFDMDSINNWSLGERYGYSMINDFNNGTVAWTDWNILLDENGGPNHVGNFCFAPVHADTKSGKLIYTNAYYYIGQFSKFIKDGAMRIAASSNRDHLQTTAFKNPDGSLVVVVMNTTDNTSDYYLWIKGRAAKMKSAAHSISSLLIN